MKNSTILCSFLLACSIFSYASENADENTRINAVSSSDELIDSLKENNEALRDLTTTLQATVKQKTEEMEELSYSAKFSYLNGFLTGTATVVMIGAVFMTISERYK